MKTTIQVKKKLLPKTAAIGSRVEWEDRQWNIIGQTSWIMQDRWTLESVEDEPEPTRDDPPQDDSSFVTSAAAGYLTGSPLMGEIAGGDMLGAVIGASLASQSDDAPQGQPEPARDDPAPEPAPMLENPDSPSSDSPSCDSGSSDSSSCDSGSSDSSSSCDSGS